MKGKLILIEGLDRIGKDTQIQELLKKIPGSVKYNFPNENLETGRRLRKYLNHEIDLSDAEINELFALNRRLTMEYIEQNLKEGQTVLLSRYAFSGVCYTVAKGQMTIEQAVEPDKGILIPSLTILMIQEPSSLVERYHTKDRYETLQLQERVLQMFLEVQKLDSVGKWFTIDCLNKSVGEVHQLIWQQVEPLLSDPSEVQSGLFE